MEEYWQVKLEECARERPMDKSMSSKLTQAIASSCWSVHIVGNECLGDIIRIASNDSTYELPSRATVVTRIHQLYESGGVETCNSCCSHGRALDFGQ